jgi:hypothetical protein
MEQRNESRKYRHHPGWPLGGAVEWILCVRVKVNMTHGNRMTIGNTAVVGVRPVPHLVEGWLKPRDQQAVYQWAAQNEAALVDYWNGTISSAEFLLRLRRLPSAR